MFTRVKQIIIFHLAIVVAMVMTDILRFDGHPSELDRRAYEALASQKSKGFGFHWKDGTLLEKRLQQLKNAPKLLSLRFGPDTASTFQSSPPSPVDYAVVLYEINQYGAKNIAISEPLFWNKEASESPMIKLGLASLNQEMSPFDRVLLGAPVSRTIPARPATAALGTPTLTSDQIQGDISSLPSANQLPFEFPQELPKQARLTPTHIEGENGYLEDLGQPLKIPLLVRWQGSVVPTFTMGLVIDLLGIDLSTIKAHIGSHIELGDEKQIPIDESGYARIELNASDAPLQLDASDLLLADGEDRQPNQSIFDQSKLVLISQADQSPRAIPASDTQPYTHRGDFFAHAASYLASNCIIDYIKLLTPTASWVNLLLLVNVSLVGAHLYNYRSKCAFGFLFLFILLAGLAYYLALNIGLWTPLAPPLTAALTCILAIPFLSQWKAKSPPATQSENFRQCEE